MKIISRLACFIKGHKRGKLVRAEGNAMNRTLRAQVHSPSDAPLVEIFACPRCGRETRYKVKQS